MSGQGFYFDQAAFRRDMAAVLGEALRRAGEQIIALLRRELDSVHGVGAPEWRGEVARALTYRAMGMIGNQVCGELGLMAEEDVFTVIKALLLEYGAGSGNADGGTPIAHIQGKPGLNSDLTGYNRNALDRASYLLPAGFNQTGARWFSAIVDGPEFNDIVEEEIAGVWDRIHPWDYIHC